MCGRLRIGKDFLHAAGLVGAAMFVAGLGISDGKRTATALKGIKGKRLTYPALR
jgi:hypothetical protein